MRETITMHPILRALINLSSSKNIMHLQYIIKAGVIEDIAKLLLEDPRRIAQNNLKVFAIQILGNIARYNFVDFSNSELAHTITDTTVLSAFLVKCFRDFKVPRDIQNEVCICLRNLVFHRNASITRYLILI
jgi:hypothetical protein